MEVSFQDLIEIGERAGSLYEILAGSFSPANDDESNKEAETRYKIWKQNTTSGDEDTFLKRLAWDGLSREEASNILKKKKYKDQSCIPHWLYTLEDVLNTIDIQQNIGNNRFIKNDEPVPFEELLIPFVNTAVKKLIKETKNYYHFLTGKANMNIERTLLKKLSKNAAMILQYEFNLYKKTGKTSYSSFIKIMQNNRFLSFLKKYPVLARLLTVLCNNWVETNSELLQRLNQDQQELKEIFNQGKEPGKITRIETGLSDRHRGGRTVISLTFSSGLKLIYKPRAMGIEDAFYKLIQWINDNTADLQNRVVKILDKKTYGWMEYIEQKSCKNEQEVVHYYQRAGMLLCILYILKGTDFHYDNLITSGEYPVLIDLEMLFSVFIPENDGVRLPETNEEALSILRTGLLPSKQNEKKNSDMSGLSGGNRRKTTFQEPEWVNINQDNMSYSIIFQDSPPGKNIVYLDKKSISPHQYLQEIKQGFINMYNFWLSNRDSVLAENGLLQIFMNKTARFVFRPTKLYYFLSNITLYPLFLKSGIDRSIELDRLSRKFLDSNEKPLLWPIIKEEHLAIERLDIPYFTFKINGDSLQMNDKTSIRNLFQPSAYELVRSGINNLSNEDLEKQIKMINNALKPADKEVKFTQKYSNCKPISKEELIGKISDIAETVMKLSRSSNFISQLSSNNLYSGRTGLALFLAALASVMKESIYSNKALQEVEVFKKEFLLTGAGEYADKFGIGVASGLGSIIFALVHISKFLDARDILFEAEKIGKLINQELILQDKHYDIISGSAGAILALLALYDSTENNQYLDQAVICGNYLLEKRVQSDTNFWGWKNNLTATPEGKLLTGFSHGQAGIAYALFRLYSVSKNDLFKQAAVEAINYEQSVFSKKARNWPDYRLAFMVDQKTPNFMNSWCHGATGIGLTRLGIIKIWDNEIIREEITTALTNIREEPVHKVDHLCCGHFGQVELLLTAYQKSGDYELYKEAMQMTSCILAREHDKGHFTLSGKGDIPDIGFFQGLSGIGYELLRLVFPEKIPSILLFEFSSSPI